MIIEVDSTAYIRPATKDDAAAILTLVESNRHHLRWYFRRDELTTIDAATIWIQNALSSNIGGLIVTSNNVVGMTRMDLQRGPEDATGELHYWIAEAVQGQGLATKCCAVLIQHGFGQLDLHRIIVRPAFDNERSRKIPERLGFTLEGRLREAQFLDDGFHDLAVYSLLEQEWNKN